MIHSQQLERWLGHDEVARVSRAMQGWYGPPIALHGVPGAVYAGGDGDFSGTLRAGYEATKLDRAQDALRRLKRQARIATSPRRRILHAGFASLSDLIANATAQNRFDFHFNKVGTTGVVNGTNSLWRVGTMPTTGVAAPAAPGGSTYSDGASGAFPFPNPASGDTLHFTTGYPLCSQQGTLLLYDKLFGVAKDLTITTAQAVTGVPIRYQNTISASADSAEGNFMFFDCVTALNAIAHNWTVCQYTDQNGNTGATMPSMVGNSACIINRLDHPLGQWFAPLAVGDIGVKAITQIQYSAVCTGAIDVIIGHPIAWMPCPIANLVCVADGINTAFNLTRIFDDAALALLEVCKPVTTAATYTGSFTCVAG